MLYQPEKVLSKKQVKQGFTNYPPHKTVDTYLFWRVRLGFAVGL